MATGQIFPGYVSQVSLTVPSWLNISGSPVTNNQQLNLTADATQSANKVLATPNGGTGALAVRSLVTADLPAGTGTVTSVGLTVPSWLSVTGSPVTTSGSFAVSATTGQAANMVLATPDLATGAIAERVLTPNDLPASLSETHSAGAVTTANNTDLNMFTGLTLAANALQSGRKLLITAVFRHTTGTSATNYKIQFGGQTVLVRTAGTGVNLSVYNIIVYALGSASQMVTFYGTNDAGGALSVTAAPALLTVDLTLSNTINISELDAALTDQFTAYALTATIV